ncbi:unnamed protein product [Diplocarpon coronariae]|uniref:Uncharacterized protein n=1 Tax=Diplocarpon coronariae TaxID=2795749 RepID=A0A218ZH28_9HELO|nr:hypothetical protein B2J93_6138 [Marssonina coronariae]
MPSSHRTNFVSFTPPTRSTLPAFTALLRDRVTKLLLDIIRYRHSLPAPSTPRLSNPNCNLALPAAALHTALQLRDNLSCFPGALPASHESGLPLSTHHQIQQTDPSSPSSRGCLPLDLDLDLDLDPKLSSRFSCLPDPEILPTSHHRSRAILEASRPPYCVHAERNYLESLSAAQLVAQRGER